jgi:hypothetical protein
VFEELDWNASLASTACEKPHYFHFGCIKDLFFSISNSTGTCPICRLEIQFDQICKYQTKYERFKSTTPIESVMFDCNLQYGIIIRDTSLKDALPRELPASLIVLIFLGTMLVTVVWPIVAYIHAMLGLFSCNYSGVQWYLALTGNWLGLLYFYDFLKNIMNENDWPLKRILSYALFWVYLTFYVYIFSPTSCMKFQIFV